MPRNGAGRERVEAMTTLDPVRRVGALVVSALLAAGPSALRAEAPGAGGPAPSAERSPGLLARMMGVPLCFPDSLTEEELTDAIIRYRLRSPAQLDVDERFWVDTLAWSGDGGQGASGQHAPAHLTYSFPADGVTWGLSAISSTGPNVLNASLVSTFGTGNLDLGREYLRQALASWRRYSALTYDEVADNGSNCDQSVSRSTARGDIRIGGRGFGTGTFLAYNAFPSASGLAGVGGGDMTINTSYFIPGNLGKPDNGYRYLRNVVAHEHGHGLGNIHSVPCDHTKLMEPFINENFEMLQVDDRRGGARSYGDRFAPNHSAVSAKDFGNLTTPVLKSIVAPDLSTNGLNGVNNTNEDWFRFTISSSQNVLVAVTPTGGTYTAGQQSSSCSGTTASIAAISAGNLAVSLYLSNGTTLQQPEVNAGSNGAAETLSASGLAAGTYYVRVRDAGPNGAANQTLQMYDLRIGVGAAKAPPYANAGLSKRIAAGSTCFFMGDLSSVALDGATLDNSSYDWDLDGDGTFETLDSPRPSTVYTESGVVPVKLRLTDSNGQVATDSINVVVFGAPTVTSVSPNFGSPGWTVPVTLTGTNLQSVTAASQVTVSGTGVTVTGAPTPSGTTVTGLSFVISGGAALGSRNVTVTDSQGSGVGIGVFTVTSGPAPPPGPFNLSAPPNNANLTIRNPLMQWAVSSDATSYDLVMDDNPDFSSPAYSKAGISGALHSLPVGAIKYRTRYFWTVTARNSAGSTVSTPVSFNFRTPNCLGDANRDGLVDFVDITSALANFGQQFTAIDPGEGDSNADGTVDFVDITTTLASWGVSCP